MFEIILQLKIIYIYKDTYCPGNKLSGFLQRSEGSRARTICPAVPNMYYVSLFWRKILNREFRLANHPAASANQNVTINAPCEKPEEWPPCLAYKPVHSNRAKRWWIPNKTFKISNGARWVMKNIRCNQTKQSAFIWKMQSASNHRTLHQSTQRHLVARSDPKEDPCLQHKAALDGGHAVLNIVLSESIFFCVWVNRTAHTPGCMLSVVFFVVVVFFWGGLLSFFLSRSMYGKRANDDIS